MRLLIRPLALCLSLAPASVAVLAQDAEIVVKIGGEGYTDAQLSRIRNTLPDQFRQNVAHMHNKAFVETYANLLALANASEQSGLLEEEPYKSQFAFLRLNFLAQNYLGRINSTLSIGEEERKQYYEDHAAEFSEFHVSAIHVEYDPLPELAERAGRAPVSEQEARAEAEKLLAEIRAGGDFAALAKEHSDDTLSAKEGGSIGWLSRDTKLPAALKEAVFALQEGRVSAAVKDGGKFYIFKVNTIRSKPYEDVRSDILSKLQGSKLKAKLEEIRATMPVEFLDADYAAALPAAK